MMQNNQPDSRLPSADDTGQTIPPQPTDGPVKAGSSVELQRFWQAIRRLPAYLRLTTAMIRDPRVPVEIKAILGAGGTYLVSPVDLIPGIIPVAGQLDDLYVVLTAIQIAVKRTPASIVDPHLDAVGIHRSDIDGDLKSIRDVVRVAVMKTVRFGGNALGRVSRATIRFANEQFRQWQKG